MTRTKKPKGLDWKTEDQRGVEGTVSSAHPGRPSVCVGVGRRPLSLASSPFSSLKSHPRGAQQPCTFTPGLDTTVLSSWKPSNLVNHLSQKLHTAITLGSQEQHNVNAHSCDEFRFTPPWIPFLTTHKALRGVCNDQ